MCQDGDLLHGHLRHHLEAGEVFAAKVLFVLAHLDGLQPFVHRAEGREVGRAAIQKRQMDTGRQGGDKADRSARERCYERTRSAGGWYLEESGVVAFRLLGLRIILSSVLTIWLNLGLLLRSFCQQSSIS